MTIGTLVGRGNQYVQLVKVLYCKLPTIGKILPTYPHKVRGLNHRPQRWEGVVQRVSWKCNHSNSMEEIIHSLAIKCLVFGCNQHTDGG